MSKDFFVKYFSASSVDEETCSRLDEPRERVAALLPLLYKLIQSESKPDDIQVCPTCGQTMEVSFSKRFQASVTMSIGVDCKTCHIIVLFTSDKVPTWVPVQKFWN